MQTESKIDDNSDNKRKRSDTSSASELENSLNSENTSEKNKKKKSKKMTTIKEKASKVQTSKTEKENDTIAAQLKELILKMSNVLTKDDKSLKTMIKGIFKDMKEDFLKSVFHRIELLESKIYEKDQENDKLKEHIQKLNEKIEAQEAENISLKKETEQTNVKVNGKINDLEQYGRRNNVRIDGLINRPDETPAMTTNLVINALNDNIEGLELNHSDIDTAHRIGKVKFGNKRQIIVKFISRMTRDKLMSQKYQLKNTGIFVNEDLTFINQHVLASLRKKLPDEVDQAWSQNGRLWYKNKMGHKHQLEYKDFQTWIDLDWPKNDVNTSATNPVGGIIEPEAME